MSIDGIASYSIFGRATILAVFVLLYAIAMALAFPQTFITLLFESFVSTAIYAMLVISVVVILVASIIARPQAPLSFMRERIIVCGFPAIIITLFFCLGLASFTTFKFRIVSVFGFYADPMLADLDVWLHGIDPWRFTHDIYPGRLVPYLVIAYGKFYLIQFLATLIYVALFTDEPERTRYLTALSVTIVLLGSLLATIGSSAGPIFYDRLFGGQRFSELINNLSSNSATNEYLDVAEYLYASYQNDAVVIGSGISAMPSVHVGIVVLNALFFSSRSFVLGLIAWIYATMVAFGSVYLGFHYATDGYVSLIVVLVVWRATRVRGRR